MGGGLTAVSPTGESVIYNGDICQMEKQKQTLILLLENLQKGGKVHQQGQRHLEKWRQMIPEISSKFRFNLFPQKVLRSIFQVASY